MRSRPRRQSVVHVLIAGDQRDLAAIGAVVASLPSYAFGQVYVETDAGVDLPELSTPPRVTVTHLRRTAQLAVSAPGEEGRGRLLATAVTGWVAEWMPQEPTPDREFGIWIGSGAGAVVAGACDGLATIPERS